MQLIVEKDNGKKTSMSYPKYLVERFIGRKLKDDETVDHIDHDFTNNWVSNLRIIGMSEHASDDNIRVEPIRFVCPICKMEAEKSPCVVFDNRRQGKVGPFCGKKCAGTYSQLVQVGKIKPEDIDQSEFERSYFYKEKSTSNIPYEEDVNLEVLFRDDFKKTEPKKTVFDSCCVCGKEYPRKNGRKYCSQKCFKFTLRKVDRPSLSELMDVVNKHGYSFAGRKYGVSDNAVRKWIKNIK